MNQTKKKILVTASTFPRWENDTEPRFVLDLCKAMLTYYDITVLVPATPGARDRETLEGVNVIRYHYFPVHRWETLCYPGAIVPRIREKKTRVFLVPFLFLGLYRALRKHLPKYDLVHAHWLIPQGIVQSFFDTPYIVTGHGGDIKAFNKSFILSLKRRCINRASSVAVVSQAAKEILSQIDPTIAIQVISMGVNASNFGQQFRKVNYFNQNGKPVVLYVGRLASIKGVSYLIKAMSLIQAKLIIVGDGPERQSLEQEVALYSVDVQFLGSKTHGELKTIYASSDVLVIPSITDQNGNEEGVPTVLFEAMASGVPIIASKTGGIPDIIENGRNGLLCEEKSVWQIADSISTILDDHSFADMLVKNALLTVREYDYSHLAKRYSNLIYAALFSAADSIA